MTVQRISALLFGVIAVLLIHTALLQAQSPRISLVEEATNASCGPCAAQNPAFEAWFNDPANEDRLVTVIWHANWPGPDVMNEANPEMHDARTSYYGITGVPNAVVNGLPKLPGERYGLRPSNTHVLDSLVGLVEGTMSPITLTVQPTACERSVTADVTISTAEPLSEAVLQIVITEGYHYYEQAGYNGEKEFYRIARKMYPDRSGTLLDMAAGETETVSVSFPMDPEWNTDEVYIVAFVQDMRTKEVLQAAEGGPFDLLDFAFEGTDPLVHYEAQENAPHEFVREFTSPADGDYGYMLESTLPEGWNAEVYFNAQKMTESTVVQMDEGDRNTVAVKIIPGSGIQRYGTVKIAVSGPKAATESFEATLYSAPIDVLMYMRDEGGANGPLIEEQYRMAFEYAENWNFALVPRGREAMFDPSDYPVFAVEAGKKSLAKADVDMIKSYLDGGGRLWLMGAEIAYGLADPAASNTYRDKAFLNDYLHADFVADDANPTTSNSIVYGVDDDPIGDGLMVKINDASVKNQDQPDVLALANGGIACFTYGRPDEVAGVRYAGAGSAVAYYGFGIECIRNTSWIRGITQRTMEWLMSTTSTGRPEPAPDGFSVAAYPNPATGATRIPVTLERAQDITLALYNVYGQRVATVHEGPAQAGTTDYTYNVEFLPAGAYILRVHAGDAVTSTMVSVVR